MHFAGKDDLLVSGIEAMLLATQPRATGREGIVGFARPIFEHIHQQRAARSGLASFGTRAVIHERLRKVLPRRSPTRCEAISRGPPRRFSPTSWRRRSSSSWIGGSTGEGRCRLARPTRCSVAWWNLLWIDTAFSDSRPTPDSQRKYRHVQGQGPM
jgi:hypothetical protein